MSASARRDGDTTATLDASEWAPPTPSTCIGWPLPITASSSASRSAGSLGRSVARKYRPFEVPPRISMHRTPLTSLPPSRALGLGPRWLRAAGPRRRDTATAPGAPYAAFGPAPAAFPCGLRLTEAAHSTASLAGARPGASLASGGMRGFPGVGAGAAGHHDVPHCSVPVTCG